MEFYSINPYNGKKIGQYTALSTKALDAKLDSSAMAFKHWSQEPLAYRSQLLKKASRILNDNVEEYAQMISTEMGKPISESRAEVKKCIWVCDFYAEHAASFLAREHIQTEASQSYVRHDPIGAVLGIMPWNFPFWQVFRFAAPTLMAGNTCLLKHAPNVFGCAEKIESIFTQAGFPEGVFQNLVVHHNETERIIAHDSVKAVSLTGSEMAGSAVAQIAGKYLKKSLLELGGNNAFIVLDDADVDKAVETAVVARMLNAGQSCIAAKRFILTEGVYEAFVSKFTTALNQLKAGDPLDDHTQIGVLARKDLADQLQRQVQESVAQGAVLLLGGMQDNCFHEPSILGNVKPGMPCFDQETFGPLAAMVKAKDTDDAFALAEQSKYGLGLSVFTKNTEKALEYASIVSDGAFFVNEMVKSDPRLPFGGSKASGYGRELAKDGIMEFVNRKTVFVK